MAEWIDVNDRLPDSDRYCWVTLRRSGEVAITWYNPWESEWDQFGSSIVAWMYVEGKPEPYKSVKRVKYRKPKTYKPVKGVKNYEECNEISPC